jgi:hypothetical protein
MVYQQYTTAIVEGYRGRSAEEVAEHAAEARRCREWLTSLAITPSIRAGLVEQMRALEEAFGDVLRSPRPPISERRD